MGIEVILVEKNSRARSALHVPSAALRVLIWGAALVALVSAVLWGQSPVLAFSLWIAIGIFAPVVFTSGVIFGHGIHRAFCIGALFPAALALAICVCVLFVSTFDGWYKLQRADGLIMGVPVAIAAIVLSGFSAVAVGRYVQSARFVSLGQMLLGGKWQFSLSSLLGLTAACAVVITVMAVLPDSAGTLILAVANLFMPVVLTIILVYGQPASRTFCIGALFPASLSFCVAACLVIIVLFEGAQFPGDDDVAFGLRMVTGVTWLAMVATGRLAQASRDYFARTVQRDD